MYVCTTRFVSTLRMEQQIALLGPCNAQLLFISTEDFNSNSGSTTLLRVRVFSYCPPAASGVESNNRVAGTYEDVKTGAHLILADYFPIKGIPTALTCPHQNF